LIHDGHPPETVWNYTPGQASAFVAIAEKRKKREWARQLSIATTAARGASDDVKALHRELSSDI
jgi:hypothetical protein